MTGIEYIKNAVFELLKTNSNGHDDKHVFRVYDTAMKFCDEILSANRDLVAAAAVCPAMGIAGGGIKKCK